MYAFGGIPILFYPFSGGGGGIPPVENDFLLLDGTDFLLLDGTNFLLLDP